MEKKGISLLKLARHFSHERFNSLRPYFHYSKPVSDHLQENDVIDDDWELIEVLDQEFAGEGDEEDVELFDLDELEDSYSTFLRLASHHKIKYRILSKADVRRLLEDKVSRVSTVLSLSRSEAVILLNHFNWRVSRVHDEWLTCQEKVRKAVGLFERPVVETSDTNEIACSFCYKSCEADNMVAISCGHQMCLACWTEYISEAINGGPECLTLRCPEGSCEAAVGIGLIEVVSNQVDKKKFDDYLLQSFVTGRNKVKWCPAPDCEYAVTASIGEDSNNDVTCKCLHSFCWNCSKEAHAPVNCVRVGEWLSEINAQSINWILAKAKPCPNCEKLIEETSCQIYSQCTLCGNVFNNGAFSERAPDNEDAKLNDHVRELAKSSLEGFEQYYEGWSISEASRVNAVTELKVLEDIRLEFLCSYLDLPPMDLDFLVEAHLQVIHCWRLLKWMHVYGYYVPEDEDLKVDLLDFMLEQAVKLLGMVEKHVDEFVTGVFAGEISSTQYTAFRGKIMQLTRVTRHYFDRLVEALQADLCEVVSISKASSSPKTDEASCSCPSPGPTCKVIKTKPEEGSSSSTSFVDMRSGVLIPSSTPQKVQSPTLCLSESLSYLFID